VSRPSYLALTIVALVVCTVVVRSLPVSRHPEEGSAADTPFSADPAASATPADAAGGSPRNAASAASLLNAQALNAWHTGDIDGAMTLFEQAIDEYPDDPEPCSNYGRLLTLMADYETALPLLERARDLRPDEAQPWLDLATLYERAQQFEKAWAAREQAANLVGSEAIQRDSEGRFVVEGHTLW